MKSSNKYSLNSESNMFDDEGNVILDTILSNNEFINEEDFREKVEALKESYFPQSKKQITEDVVEEDPVKQINGTMGVYTSTLDRMLS